MKSPPPPLLTDEQYIPFKSWTPFEAATTSRRTSDDQEQGKSVAHPMYRVGALPRNENNDSSDEEIVIESKDKQLYHQQLHALHRIRRQKKRDLVISYIPRARASIVDRQEFFYRFGEKEQEAMACFDFLDALGAGSSANEHQSYSSSNFEEEHQLLLNLSLMMSTEPHSHNKESTAGGPMLDHSRPPNDGCRKSALAVDNCCRSANPASAANLTNTVNLSK